MWKCGLTIASCSDLKRENRNLNFMFIFSFLYICSKILQTLGEPQRIHVQAGFGPQYPLAARRGLSVWWKCYKRPEMSAQSMEAIEGKAWLEFHPLPSFLFGWQGCVVIFLLTWRKTLCFQISWIQISLLEKKGMLPSVSDPPDPSVSSLAIWEVTGNGHFHSNCTVSSMVLHAL